MLIDAVFTARTAAERRFDGIVTVVIDVLRATSSMATLLAGGCRRVYTVAEVNEAFALRDRLGNALLCGERDGFAVEGFDYGNSPSQFSRLDLAGTDVVLTTTNGTLAVANARGSRAIVAACIRNATAAAETALREADAAGCDEICLLCAGTEGIFSLDDVYAAGLVAARLLDAPRTEASDAVAASLLISSLPLPTVLADRNCRHMRTLTSKGFEEDIAYCLERDAETCVPHYDTRGFFRRADELPIT